MAERMRTWPPTGLGSVAQVALGVSIGFGSGVVAALMGVAGGELLIPAFVLLFSIETRTACTLSLLLSLPTMLVALLRYSRSRAFDVLSRELGFLLSMAAGSVAKQVLGDSRSVSFRRGSSSRSCGAAAGVLRLAGLASPLIGWSAAGGGRRADQWSRMG